MQKWYQTGDLLDPAVAFGRGKFLLLCFLWFHHAGESGILEMTPPELLLFSASKRWTRKRRFLQKKTQIPLLFDDTMGSQIPSFGQV